MEQQIEALRVSLHDGLVQRPIFIGALSAEKLDLLSDVPHFSDKTDQHVIAGHVLRPPIKEWQRPLNTEKRQAITDRFDHDGEFMPNPVLLSVGRSDLVKCEPKFVNGQATGIHTITVRLDGAAKPLWILDGQHRIKGLALSIRKTNPVPFVLLYSETPGVYKPEDSAKVFAEVSTEATPLDALHREWLQFGFKLGRYNTGQPAPAGPDAANHGLAMKTVALLCDTQEFKGGVVNPYFNKIQFNPQIDPFPVHGQGLAFSALQLKEWVYEEYYNQPPPVGGHLDALRVARELVLATRALIPAMTTPEHQSAFFGPPNKRQQYIERAFICGVLSRLLVDVSPDWPTLFSTLNFHGADWDFSWVKTTGGSAGTTSKKIARAVFVEAFRGGNVPHGCTDLVSYLKGDKAVVSLVASNLTPKRMAAKAGKKSESFEVSGSKVFDTGGRPHVCLEKGAEHTSNVGKLHIYDPDSARAKVFTVTTFRSGVIINVKQDLKISAETYGGREFEMELTIKVS